MIGAPAMLLLFLLLDTRARGILFAIADDAQQRYFDQQPFSELVLAVMVAAALLSALIMLLWPRNEPPRPQFVVRRYTTSAGPSKQARGGRFSLLRWLRLAFQRNRPLPAFPNSPAQNQSLSN